MSDFRENRSEGLGQAIGRGDYATPLAKDTEPHFTQSIVEGVKLAGNIALACAAVGVGSAFYVVFDGPGKIKKAAKNIRDRLLDTIPHDIEAGKYLD
jgi:hypothetical protein